VALGDTGPTKPVDFFISYTSADRVWAEWIAWQLEEAGYHVVVQAWDIVPGVNFVERMDRGIQDAGRTIAVLSPEYLTSVYTKLELQAAYRRDPEGLLRKLLPVRVGPCEPEGLLAVIVYIDLLGLDEPAARECLLAGVRGSVSGRTKPERSPAFPAARAIAARPQFPTEPGPDDGSPARSAITVLHLSEPRFTTGAGADGGEAALAALPAEVDRLAAEAGVHVDLVVVTGDLADAGRPSELARARAFLVSLTERLGLGPERLAIVPGDRDVSRSASLAYFNTCEADEVAPAPPYWPKWRHFAPMLRDLYRGVEGVVFDSEQPWTLFEVADLQVVVAGLNSTMAESHRPDDHHGLVGEAQAGWFAERLAAYADAGWLRVGAVHHAPLPGLPAVDSLRDADMVDRVLRDLLNVLLHGNDGAAGRDAGRALLGTGGKHRYQLLRLELGGLARWSRRYDPDARSWVPDGPAQPEWLSRTWTAVGATFPEPVAADAMAATGPAAPAPPRPVGAGDPSDDLLTRVAEVCALRHPGAMLRRLDGDVPHLLVTYREEGFVRQLRVGAHAGNLTRDVVEAFVSRVHAGDPEPWALLVHQGEPLDSVLEYEALSRGVRLMSFTEYRGLVDLRGYIARQTSRLAGDGLYPPELYVAQRYRALDLLDAPVGDDLAEAVLRMLASDQGRFVLLLGDFGRGKTFLLRELARRIPERLPHLTPVLIELRALEKARTVDELVAQQLAANGEDRIDLAAFRYMLRTGQIALLFDGFDELALRITYDRAAVHLDTLLQAAEGQAKIVATSRTQHFLSHAQALTALGERVGLLPTRRLLEIEDFSEEQIHAFLANRYGGDRDRADSRFAMLREIGDLLGLSRNPRMLWFIADLDEDQLRAVRSRSGEIGAADLYRQILDSWLAHEVNRLEVAGAPSSLDRPQRWHAVTALALRLWQSNERAIDLGDLSETARVVLADLADLQMSEEQAAHVVGSGTLLTRTGDGLFAFVHGSVTEWLVAADAARRFAGGDLNPAPLRWRQMSPLMVDFLCDLAERPACRGWADAVLADPDAGDVAKGNALRISERIRSSAGVRADLRGRNLRGEDFSDRDLRWADLTDADLTEARLAGTDLTGAALCGARLVDARLDRALLAGADLRGADLTRARLLGADLRGATLAGSRWRRASLVGAAVDDTLPLAGELGEAAIHPGQPIGLELAPAEIGVRHSFERGALAGLVAFSPDGETMAVGVESGCVVLCDARSGLPLRSLTGHASRIWSLAHSPDGSLLVTTSADRTARLWDPVSGRHLRTLSAPHTSVWPATFSPDGRLLATAGEDGVVRIRDSATGEPRHVLTGHSDWLWSLAFSPDGSLLATAGLDGSVRLWDPLAGRPLAVLEGHVGAVWSAAFSPDGTLLATAGNDGTVGLWDPAAGAEVARLAAHHGAVWAVAFDRAAGTLASAGADHVVRLWDPRTGRRRHELRGHTDQVWSAAFSPDGAVLATGANDHAIVLWDPATGERRHTLTGHAGPVCSLAFRPDGGLLATTGNDDALRLWNPATGRLHHTVAGHGERAWSVAFSPDGAVLASGGSGGIGLWDTATGRRRTVLSAVTGEPTTIAYSPGGTLVATVGTHGRILLWDARTGAYHHTVSGQTDWVWALAFSADGRLLATANDDDTVRLWDMATGREQLSLTGHRGRVRSIAFDRTGTLVATASDDRTMRLWDLATGAHRRTLAGHTDRVYSVAFHPEGRLLATGSSDATVRLWDVATGSHPLILPGHADRVWAVAFDPSGGRLVSASADHTARLWDTATGEELDVLAGHTDQVWSAAFGPGGALVATAGNDGTVRVWNLANGVRASPHLTLVGLPDGWAALAADGRYKVEGDPAGRFWHVVGRCRFEPGELDPHVPAIRRLAEDAPF
jgi:WD40 repeat protein/3',5'-cyclic AMP phosphodiesterase CpdA